MANEFGLFFNSINNDRTYEAGDFTEWLRKFFTTGVFSGDLAVTAGTGMRVTLGTGYCNIEGKVRFFDAPTTLNIAQANSSYPRIDTVVIECNYTDREITAKVVTGAYSGSNPQPTAPVRNDEVYQIVVAEVYVNVGATSITDAVITDKRFDSSVCGIVAGSVQEMDFSSFESQFNTWMTEFEQSEAADFETWFEAIRGQLDEDAAGHLQNEVDALDTRVEALEDAADLGLTTDGTTLTSAQEFKASNGLVVTGGRPAIVDENGDAVVGGDYGSTPVYTGMHWVDGKKVYLKIVRRNLSSTGSFQDVGTLGDFESIVAFYGSIQDLRTPTGGYYALPYVFAVPNGGCGLYVDTSGVVKIAMVNSGTTFSNCLVTVVCYYTRTND